MIANENDLRLFTEFEGVTAGFTRKPDTSDVRRNQMTAKMEKIGGCVIKPILVHGKEVVAVTKEMIAGMNYLEIPNTDGVVTNLSNVVLTTTHADCIPLYVFDSVKKVIGVAHAGWKGTSNGIAKELVTTMVETYDCKPENITAYIGPGICKDHFEFGKDYAEECFTSKYAWMKEYIIDSSSDRVHIDLKGINKRFFELAKVGVIKISDDCTYCDERYYSFRRAKDTERMLAYITMQ